MERNAIAPRSQRDYDLHRERQQAEIRKLAAESRKLDKESSWYPFAAGVAFMGAAIALSKQLFF